jgi:hypothetical protein
MYHLLLIKNTLALVLWLIKAHVKKSSECNAPGGVTALSLSILQAPQTIFTDIGILPQDFALRCKDNFFKET